MKQFLIFVRKEWFHIRRDTRTLVILFGLPIMQILIFGFALTNEVKNSHIAVIDPSRDAFSQRLIARIEASRYFEVTRYPGDYTASDRIFKSGDARMVLILPDHFADRLLHQKQVTIQLLADASDPNYATTLINYASTIIQDYQTDVNNGNTVPLVIRPEIRMLYNPELKGAFNFVPGVMAMVLMLVCTLMTSISIVREKELGTMEVLLVSPLKPFRVILAKTIPYFALSFVNICSILVLSVFLLDLPIAGSLPLLLALSMLFTLTSLSLGILISSITNSQQTAMMISLMGMFLPTLMLSGFMFPIENMPLPLQVISNIVPSKWFFYIVKAVMIKGLGFSAIWRETAILTGMTILFTILSIKKYNVRLGG